MGGWEARGRLLRTRHSAPPLGWRAAAALRSGRPPSRPGGRTRGSARRRSKHGEPSRTCLAQAGRPRRCARRATAQDGKEGRGGSVHRIGRGDGGGGNDGRTFLTAPPRRAFLRSESGSQLLLSSSASVGGMPRRHRPTMTVSAHPQPRRERHLGHQGSSIPTLAPHPRPSSPPAACRLLPPVIAPPASTRPPPTQVPHAMFRPGAYRRALKHLTAMLHVVGHTTALQLNRRQRFETFGPWPHGPARA